MFKQTLYNDSVIDNFSMVSKCVARHIFLLFLQMSVFYPTISDILLFNMVAFLRTKYGKELLDFRNAILYLCL